MVESAEGSTGRVFISYRHQETAWPAQQLYDVLVEHFPGGQVFKDIDNIGPGEDFVQRITAAVESCEVLLALIGPEWLTLTNKKGQRRLDDPEDFVRLEIEAALTRSVRVIPILVDGATMPGVEELPPSLAGLVRRQALEVSPARFDFDTSPLLKVLEEALRSKNGSSSGPKRTLRRVVMIGVPFAALLAIYLIIQFVLGQPTPPQDSGAQSSATNEFKPTPVSLPASKALSDTQLLVDRYVDEDWKLHLADTRSPRPGPRLTNRRGSDTQPALSPDRRTVIYVHFDKNGTASLRVAGAADLNGDRVLFKLPTGCSYPLFPAWNPTDATLLAIGCRESRPPALHPGPTIMRLMRTDGTVVNIVKPPADQPRTGHLAFSADGTRLGFWASSDESANDGRLYTVDVAGGTPEPVFPTQDPAAAHDANLAFSPDGEHIAFTRPRGGQYDIFVAGTDGNDLMPLTSTRAVDDSPTWSPDGQWIAFRSAAPTSAWPGKPLRRIWVTSSTKDDPRVLWTQDAPEEQRHPTWR